MFESIYVPFKITTKERLEGHGWNKMYEWILCICLEHNMDYIYIYTHTHTYSPVVNWLSRVGEHHDF